MSRRFTQEFKVQAVEKALSQCDDARLEDIAYDLGVGYSTLHRWIALAKNHELETKDNGSHMSTEKRPHDWSLEDRLNAIIECASLDEAALNEYCRAKGLYPQCRASLVASNRNKASRKTATYFRHKTKASCQGEILIHRLAKQIIEEEKYVHSPIFQVSFTAKDSNKNTYSATRIIDEDKLVLYRIEPDHHIGFNNESIPII
ncbi:MULTISPECIES: transposase [Pseudoalteromonas]|uniref:transposase n=1 Tax=Pseudoalteromonas TaxID=53246 RepID=UPI0009DF916B|nr:MULTISPECIES: transposase [Pseudoalteromonas]ATG57151.1 hypothetical protein CPA52_02330 [Pseudoalteromonas marina]